MFLCTFATKWAKISSIYSKITKVGGMFRDFPAQNHTPCLGISWKKVTHFSGTPPFTILGEYPPPPPGNSSSLIPNFSLLHYIAECRLSGSNGQVHNLKIGTVTSDLPCRVLLPVEPTLFAFNKTTHGKNWGNHHWNASLCAADLLMKIVSL